MTAELTGGPTCKVCGHGSLAHLFGDPPMCRRCPDKVCQDGPDGRLYRTQLDGHDQAAADRITAATYTLAELGVHTIGVDVEAGKWRASGLYPGRGQAVSDPADDVPAALEALLDVVSRWATRL